MHAISLMGKRPPGQVDYGNIIFSSISPGIDFLLGFCRHSVKQYRHLIGTDILSIPRARSSRKQRVKLAASFYFPAISMLRNIDELPVLCPELQHEHTNITDNASYVCYVYVNQPHPQMDLASIRDTAFYLLLTTHTYGFDHERIANSLLDLSQMVCLIYKMSHVVD